MHDKLRIRDTLMRDPELHIYELGDLDDFFWPRTTWYADGDDVALIYDAGTLPVLLALTRGPEGRLEALLRSILHLLPRRFYAHLSPGLRSVFEPVYRAEPHGRYQKMALRTRDALSLGDTSMVIPLGRAHLPAIDALYRAAYPSTWFDPRTLDTGRYFGVFEGESLVGISGIHVYAPSMGVAALGNIATHPDRRGRHLATTTTRKLLRTLLGDGIERIGLNVDVENTPAIRCYEQLGFSVVAPYEEHMFEAAIVRT